MVLDPGEDNNSLFLLLRGPSIDGSWALCMENLGNSEATWHSAVDNVPNVTIPDQCKEINLAAWETRWIVWDVNGKQSCISSLRFV
jgi:hypothetical protein